MGSQADCGIILDFVSSPALSLRSECDVEMHSALSLRSECDVETPPALSLRSECDVEMHAALSLRSGCDVESPSSRPPPLPPEKFAMCVFNHDLDDYSTSM